MTGQIRSNRGDVRAFQECPTGEDGQSSGPLLLTVLFTTVPATLAALRRAAVLADQLGARIRIFVPYAVPYPLPLDCPQADPSLKIRQFRTLCERGSIETRIEVKLCRDVRECLAQELAPQSVLLIGDERGSRFSGSSRLAKTLQRQGHHVLVIRQYGGADEVAFPKATGVYNRKGFTGLLPLWTWLLVAVTALVLVCRMIW